jgi:RimJ/RimL family protein N-acetyltransferase
VVVEGCTFRTERLSVEEWRRTNDAAELAAVVSTMLTPPVTESLPPGWQGSYDPARARRWIAERDAEATTMLVSERSSGSGVGLLLLHEEPAADAAGIEVRLGYLLAERAWGRGLGGELVSGFVRWCHAQPTVTSVVGGVAPGNVASMRILERNGFLLVDRVGHPGDELVYRLGFASRS